MIFNKQRYIESYKNACSLKGVGLPSNIFNQLYYLDKKIDVLEEMMKGANKGSEHLKKLDEIYNKYDWMVRHFNNMANPNSKERKAANKKADKQMANAMKANRKAARNKWRKQFNKKPPVLTEASGSPKEIAAFNKLKQDPEGRRRRIMQKTNNAAESDEDKAEIKKAMKNSDPPKGIPKGNAKVPAGPSIPDSAYGAAFA